MRNPFKKRTVQVEATPFKNKMALAKFLGTVAAALINGDVSHEEVTTTEKLVVDFYKLLKFQDFSFEALSVGEPERKPGLRYST